jgi:arylsulfatase A-like enzyme
MRREALRGRTAAAAAALLWTAITACGSGDRAAQGPGPPSILLVVLDTVRADAVSAYGAPTGVTPELDALAAAGLLYERAYAPSPWTVPSHASLFTGLGPEHHGTGLHGRMILPEEAETLAERLAAAGYRTAAFAENSLLGKSFGMHQGFDHAVTRRSSQTVKYDRPGRERFELLRHAREWLATTSPDEPLFVFANLYGAHAPYRVRETNPFVPDGLEIREEELRRPGAPPGGAIAYSAGICDRLPSRDNLEVLRGLYLGEVAEVDAQLGELYRLLTGSGSPQRRWVVLVTADHGEHFGEHQLLGHEFSVRAPVLRIPLVVHGLAGIAPARLPQPVRLEDVTASILAWADVPQPDELTGRPLPTSPTAAVSGRSMLAVFTDSPPRMPGARVQEALIRGKRFGCRPKHRVFGDTWSLLRFPYKLIAFEQHPPELYDLSWDPRERSDRAEHEPAARAALEAELAALRRTSLLAKPGAVPELTPEQ